MDALEIMNKYKVVHDKQSLLQLTAFWQFSGRKIVMVRGCFEYLTPENFSYLDRAAALGDALLIIVCPNEKTQGKDPELRELMLAALFFVDAVFFSEEEIEEVITAVRPDVFVAPQGTAKKEDVKGYDIVEAYGGEVTIIS